MLLGLRLKTAVLELFLGTWNPAYDVTDWVVTENEGGVLFQDGVGSLQMVGFPNASAFEQIVERVIGPSDVIQIAKRNIEFTGRHDCSTGFVAGGEAFDLKLFSSPNADGTGLRTLIDQELDMADNFLFTLSGTTPDDHASLVLEWRYFSTAGSNLGNRSTNLSLLELAYVE
jgi:hypothetical protein